jgi:signal transduction histidine kinase
VVAADAVERLFEPFQRLGDDRPGSDGHHGLGLSIVRAIATAHGAVYRRIHRPTAGFR